MKVFLSWFAFMSALYVVQSSLLPLISYHGVSADLMLLLSVSFAFLRGERQGVLMGFLAGLFEDLATGTMFGVNTFLKMTTGYFCGSFSNNVFKDQIFLPVTTVAIATGVCFLAEFVFFLLLGYSPDLAALAARILIPGFIFNIAFALPVHFLVRRMCAVTDAMGKKRSHRN